MEAKAKPLGQMLGWAAHEGKEVTCLHGQEHLGPIRDPGKTEAALCEWQMQRFIDQPLKAASPEEFTGCML